MLAPLGVCEVRAVILMDRKTQSTLEASDMVLEDVRVFVEVDGLEREFAQSLSSVGVGCGLRCDTAASEFGASTILVGLLVFARPSG